MSTAYIDDGPQLAIVRHEVQRNGDVVMDQPLSPTEIGKLCLWCGDAETRCSVRVQTDPGEDVPSPLPSGDYCAECAPGLIRRAVGELRDHGRVVVAVLDEPIALAVAA